MTKEKKRRTLHQHHSVVRVSIHPFFFLLPFLTDKLIAKDCTVERIIYQDMRVRLTFNVSHFLCSNSIASLSWIDKNSRNYPKLCKTHQKSTEVNFRMPESYSFSSCSTASPNGKLIDLSP